MITKKYIGTDLLEKNCWLLSTPYLDIIDHEFSEDLISLYGYDNENDIYVGESINRIIEHGPQADKVLVSWSAQELESQISDGWWTIVSATQIVRVHTKITEAEEVCKAYALHYTSSTMLSEMIPTGYSWERYPAGNITFLTKENLSYKDSVGYYTHADQEWTVYLLQPEESTSRFNLEQTSSEIECRAKIIDKLIELDPNQDIYIFNKDFIKL